MFKDEQLIKGRVEILLHNEAGGLVDRREIDNLVVNTGKNWLAARAKTTGQPTEMTHMAVGTGAVAPAAGDTALGTELARVALSTSGGTVAGAVVTYSAVFPAGTGTGALTEAGIFNAASAGTMLNRVTFSVINKGASDSISITWTLTVS